MRVHYYLKYLLKWCQLTTVSVLYLPCSIFGRKRFYNKLAWIWNSIFLNVLILIVLTFNDVLDPYDLAIAPFREKRLKEYTAKCDMFTVNRVCHTQFLPMCFTGWCGRVCTGTLPKTLPQTRTQERGRRGIISEFTTL